MKNTSSSRKSIHKTHSPQKQSRIATLSISIALGTGVGLLCFSLLIFIFSALCLALDDPHSLTLALSLAAIYLSALAAGFASVRRNHREDALLCGAITGALLTLLLCLLLLLVPVGNDEAGIDNAIILRLLVVPLSVVGSFVGSMQKKLKRHKKFKNL